MFLSGWIICKKKILIADKLVKKRMAGLKLYQIVFCVTYQDLAKQKKKKERKRRKTVPSIYVH